jgi:hypothetical protein
MGLRYAIIRSIVQCLISNTINQLFLALVYVYHAYSRIHSSYVLHRVATRH